MKTYPTPRILSVLGIVVLAACDDGAPTEPFLEEPVAATEAVELAVLADVAALDAALDLSHAVEAGAARRGHTRTGEARAFNARARIRFENAREAFRSGDRGRALEEAREGRRQVVRALEAIGGDQAVNALVERIEGFALTAALEGDVLVDPGSVGSEMEVLAASARSALSRGDTTGAGERALLAEQRVRNRRGHDGRPGHVDPARAELAVEMAGVAVALAERLVGDAPGEEQLRFLTTAHEFLSKARAALAEGAFARAVHFAGLATWSGLKAVVLPGGITDEEIRAMVELAGSLLEEARAGLGDAPTELEVKMLEKAGRLFEVGSAAVGQGQVRGIGALWQSAVISSWLIG